MRNGLTAMILGGLIACQGSVPEDVLFVASPIQIVNDAAASVDAEGSVLPESPHVVSNCAEPPLGLATLRDVALRGPTLRVVRLANARLLSEGRELVERNSNGSLLIEATRVGADEVQDLDGRVLVEPLFVTAALRSHTDAAGRRSTFAVSAAPQLAPSRAGLGRAWSIGIGYEVAGVTLLKHIVSIESGMLLLSENERISIADFQRMLARAQTQGQ